MQINNALNAKEYAYSEKSQNENGKKTADLSKSIFDFPAPKQKEAIGILPQTANLPSQNGNG